MDQIKDRSNLRTRIVELDALRGLAVLMVVGFHYTERYQQIYGHSGPLLFSITEGSFGVQLFFMISGFVIFMTLDHTSDYRDFIVSRFARLYPPYWAAVFITYSIVTIFSLPGRDVSLSAAVVNLSMFQEWLKVRHVDGVYWTLSLELAFYTIMLLLLLLKCLRSIGIVCVGWLLIMTIVYAIEQRFQIRLPGILKTTFLLNYANLFIAGIMFYKLYRRDEVMKTSLILCCALLVEFILHGQKSGLICCFLGFIFYNVVKRPCSLSKGLLLRPFIFLGTISYSFLSNSSECRIRSLENPVCQQLDSFVSYLGHVPCNANIGNGYEYMD